MSRAVVPNGAAENVAEEIPSTIQGLCVSALGVDVRRRRVDLHAGVPADDRDRRGWSQTMSGSVTSQMGLETLPLERKLLGDEVYAALRKMIVQGRLAPGGKIVEGDLAARLGVSRTPVREALQHLEYEGWVVLQPGHSPRVVPLTTKKVEEIYPLIAVLEGLAVHQGMKHLTEADLERMEQLTAAMEQHGRRGDVEQMLAADAEFHAVLHQRSQNEQLQRMAHDLRGQLERLEYTYFSEPTVLEGSLKRHRKLVQLLRRGDVRVARRAIERQWELGQQAVMEILRRREKAQPREEKKRRARGKQPARGPAKSLYKVKQ